MKRRWMRSRSRVRRKPAFGRSVLESLEERVVPTTFTVTNTATNGAGSLRRQSWIRTRRRRVRT